MAIEIKRIYLSKPNNNNEYVTYKNQLQTRMLFNDNSLEKLFRKYEAKLMSIVEKELTEYLDDEDICNDEEDMFPQRKYLTVEWYLSEVYFEDYDYLSIVTAFIGMDSGCKDDYLELEVLFDYDEETEQFSLQGINSAAI